MTSDELAAQPEALATAATPDKAIPLARTAFQGAVQTGGAQLVRAVLTIASTVVLARILTPDDFGVIAMAAPVLAFVLLFQDLGLSAATIQARTISQEQGSTLFWVTIVASVVISLLLIAAAPAASWFYKDSRAGVVTAACSLIVLATGVSLQHTALLSRQLRFGAIASAVAVGAIFNFAATIAFALWLRNYWAIFLGNLVGSIVQAITTWISQGWRPSWSASLSQAGSMLRFGSSVAGFDLLNFFSRNMDNILIGRVWGSTALGLYDRSYSLMLAPLQMIRTPLARVMLPVMSRLVDEPERYRAAFLTSLRALLLITVPAATVAVAATDEVIQLLLGTRWSAAAPIFFWLAIASLYLPVPSSTSVLFISTGRGRALMLWGAFSSITTVLAILAGLPWGPIGVAKAYVAVTVVQTGIVVSWACRGSAVKPIDVGFAYLPFLASAITICLLVRLVQDSFSPLLLVGASLPLAYMGATGILCLFPEGRAFLISTHRLLRGMVSGQNEDATSR